MGGTDFFGAAPEAGLDGAAHAEGEGRFGAGGAPDDGSAGSGGWHFRVGGGLGG